MNAVWLGGLLLVLIASAESVGSLLRPGMQLVYTSEGVETPWTIDSVSPDTVLGGRAGCRRIRLRTSPQSESQTRAFCSDSTMLYRWDEGAAELRAARPIVGGATLDLPARAGGVVRYETGVARSERIGEMDIVVVPTTVTTRDSTGGVVQRLRERFSVGLATATGGVFEVPDPSRESGWRTVRTFELTGIHEP